MVDIIRYKGQFVKGVGYPVPPEAHKRGGLKLRGVRHSPETIQKMREKCGHPWTEEAKNALRGGGVPSMSNEVQSKVRCPKCSSHNVRERGGIVFDPFMGSGTIAVVCEKINKKMYEMNKIAKSIDYRLKWIGTEINPKYIEIALKRLKPLVEQPRLDEIG